MAKVTIINPTRYVTENMGVGFARPGDIIRVSEEEAERLQADCAIEAKEIKPASK